MVNHLIDPSRSGFNIAPPIFAGDDDLKTTRGRYRCEVWKAANGRQYVIVREGKIESLVNAREIIDDAIQAQYPDSIKIEYWPAGTVPDAPLFAMPYPHTISVTELTELGLPTVLTLP
ncbi:hypothetical protein [Bifidobacterium tibiigranuli]|uniref:hypothetical protein n=1 Tax=Bifidobacterium tibiigranuli TaxID=2172043 RepID=UPI002353D4D5|nr:hypothetical protein [Bifidobacterium tibiigranuli]MCI1211115.1 hypothetical protein [Bifidobacterium tibiigranuli]MCI1220375.1 hypothetical protein [Bifidobacterium tibiigranuli]MCI1231943.1 hypothetical protein [Bifidobacterium tibiigranuli]